MSKRSHVLLQQVVAKFVLLDANGLTTKYAIHWDTPSTDVIVQLEELTDGTTPKTASLSNNSMLTQMTFKQSFTLFKGTDHGKTHNATLFKQAMYKYYSVIKNYEDWN